MTFSRRATAEMTRAGPSMALVLGCCGNTLAKSGWIRRLRCTIAWEFRGPDDLVRHELGLSKTEPARV